MARHVPQIEYEDFLQLQEEWKQKVYSNAELWEEQAKAIRFYWQAYNEGTRAGGDYQKVPVCAIEGRSYDACPSPRYCKLHKVNYQAIQDLDRYDVWENGELVRPAPARFMEAERAGCLQKIIAIPMLILLIYGFVLGVPIAGTHLMGRPYVGISMMVVAGVLWLLQRRYRRRVNMVSRVALELALSSCLLISVGFAVCLAINWGFRGDPLKPWDVGLTKNAWISLVLSQIPVAVWEVWLVDRRETARLAVWNRAEQGMP